jgi:hypothetical protein
MKIQWVERMKLHITKTTVMLNQKERVLEDPEVVGREQVSAVRLKRRKSNLSVGVVPFGSIKPPLSNNE